MISHKTANQYADNDCEFCEGTGIVVEGQHDDIHDEYCHCVKVNMADQKGEMQMESDRGN